MSPAPQESSAATKTATPLELMEAFERLVVGVQKHPLSFLLPSDAEAIGRAVLANGLTLDQAKAVRKNLDTNAERARVKVILMQVVSFADAKLLLAWVLADLTRALKTEPPKVEPQEAQETQGGGGSADQSSGAASGAVLQSVEWAGFPKIRLKYSGTAKWPHSGSVQAMIKVNHKKVEWLHPEQTVQSLQNIFGAEYHQDVHKGQTVLISLADVHGKNETNALPLVWA